LQTYDKVIAARHAHHNTGTKIAMKVLAPYNNTNETYLTYLHNTSKDICMEQQLKRLIEQDDVRLRENIGPWTVLDQLVTTHLKEQGKILYYQREALVQEELGEINFDAGLATYWNMRTIEHRQMLPKKLVDKKCRINQRRLYVLLGLVLPILEKMNYMLVKKQSRRFCSPYNFYPVNISTRISEKLNDMIIKLVNRDNLHIPETHYLVNVISGEYTNVGNNIFFPIERIIIAKDPFRLIDDKPIPVTSGAPKNNGAKLRKNSQIFHSNDIQFNETENTHINEVNQEHNSFDNSILSEVPIDFNEQEHNSFDEFLIDCNDQEYNSFDNSILSEVPIDYNESASRFVDPHSIRRRNTTRTRNKHRNSSQTPNNEQRNDATSTIKRSLEELFLEKECSLKDNRN
ncbi:3431_t:CDS:2, partial [Cetraspora pellucida]